MSHEAAPEVHRIGSSDARIVRVTDQRIEYTDAAGRRQFVDLEECARCWVRWCHDHRQEFLPLGGASQAEIDAENARTVGLRGGGFPLWWTEFMNERKTRFEFESWEACRRELLGPLIAAGWRTFDAERRVSIALRHMIPEFTEV
jgi:hypothetical protein